MSLLSSPGNLGDAEPRPQQSGSPQATDLPVTAEALLQDLALVLHATQAVRNAMSEPKTACYPT
jgi:hypothetical protein